MSTMTVTITATDSDGCEYVRTYVDSADWSVSLSDLLSYVMPLASPRHGTSTAIDSEGAHGGLFDIAGRVVGSFTVTEG